MNSSLASNHSPLFNLKTTTPQDATVNCQQSQQRSQLFLSCHLSLRKSSNTVFLLRRFRLFSQETGLSDSSAINFTKESGHFAVARKERARDVPSTVVRTLRTPTCNCFARLPCPGWANPARCVVSFALSNVEHFRD